MAAYFSFAQPDLAGIWMERTGMGAFIRVPKTKWKRKDEQA